MFTRIILDNAADMDQTLSITFDVGGDMVKVDGLAIVVIEDTSLDLEILAGELERQGIIAKIDRIEAVPESGEEIDLWKM